MPITILRQCIHCRQHLPREGMLRLTSDGNNHFSIDGNPPLQGRSSYVCRNQSCLTEALRAKKFQRTLKRGIPDAILEALHDQLKGISSL